jgi:hypothetical protein
MPISKLSGCSNCLQNFLLFPILHEFNLNFLNFPLLKYDTRWLANAWYGYKLLKFRYGQIQIVVSTAKQYGHWLHGSHRNAETQITAAQNETHATASIQPGDIVCCLEYCWPTGHVTIHVSATTATATNTSIADSNNASRSTIGVITTNFALLVQ